MKVIIFKNRHAKPLLARQGFYGLHLPGETHFLILACTDADIQVKTVQPFVSPYKLILFFASGILLYLPEIDKKINTSMMTC
jgi:hypothetical protein